MFKKITNIKHSQLRRVILLPIVIVLVCIVLLKVQASDKVVNKGKAIKNDFSIAVSDTTKQSKRRRIKSSQPLMKPAYYIDGVKITEKEMYATSPNDIASVDVWKGEEAIKKYPKEGKNGVVFITTKKANKDTLQK